MSIKFGLLVSSIVCFFACIIPYHFTDGQFFHVHNVQCTVGNIDKGYSTNRHGIPVIVQPRSDESFFLCFEDVCIEKTWPCCKQDKVTIDWDKVIDKTIPCHYWSSSKERLQLYHISKEMEICEVVLWYLLWGVGSFIFFMAIYSVKDLDEKTAHFLLN